MLKTKTIIWDWNGTLLDDVGICVACMNRLLKIRNIPLIDEHRYREVFTFPVADYYRAIGFDFAKEAFEGPANEFINYYQRALPDISLFEETISTLQFFKQKGLSQFVLSAMEQDTLDKSLNNNKIQHYFDGVFGLNDHYAKGKVEAGKRLISGLEMQPNEMVMIGDTLHDLEVAHELGFSVVLVANGHQSKKRLLASGHNMVIDSLAELPGLFNS